MDLPPNSHRTVRGARTLDRGLMLLETLAAGRQPMGITELARRCELDKSTVHRLVTTFLERGYLRQDPHTHLYSLGLKIFDLYDALQGQLGLQEGCRPFLLELQEASGETAHFAVLSGAQIVFVDWVSTRQVMGVQTMVGRGEPAHCTALGKAILAALSEEERAAVLAKAKLGAYTDKTTTQPEALERELAEIAQRGWALDNEEFILGVRCISAAVLDRAERPVGALGISAPATRLTLERCEELGPYIHKVALRASAVLGRVSAHW